MASEVVPPAARTLIVGVEPAHPEQSRELLHFVDAMCARGEVDSAVLVHALLPRLAGAPASEDRRAWVSEQLDTMRKRRLPSFGAGRVDIVVRFQDASDALREVALERGSRQIAIGWRDPKHGAAPPKGVLSRLERTPELEVLVVARPVVSLISERPTPALGRSGGTRV